MCCIGKAILCTNNTHEYKKVCYTLEGYKPYDILVFQVGCTYNSSLLIGIQESRKSTTCMHACIHACNMSPSAYNIVYSYVGVRICVLVFVYN